MPSDKNPSDIVNPGPGKILPGQITLGTLGQVGGGSADLLAHIADPTDAHMAGAIGIPLTYPLTGEALLSLAGGPYDGESVLDALYMLKDTLPVRPNPLGVNDTTIPNSGVPSWGTLKNSLVGGTATGGGYRNGASVEFTRYLAPSTTTTFVASGTLYPADRGVLALYKSATHNFLDGSSTLVAALWLGTTASKPVALTVPVANFVEASRTGQQTDHTASLVGLDLFTLQVRLPYLRDYTPYAGVYSNYSNTFPAYQLATFSVSQATPAAGDNGSFLLVHWKPTFAISDAAVAGSNLLAGTLVAGAAYSATPVAGDFDTGNVTNINRHRVFRDTSSALAPAGSLFSSNLSGVPTTKYLSGVAYMNGTAGVSFGLNIQVTDLFANTFRTDATPDGVNTPMDFPSEFDPLALDFSDFGASALSPKSYNNLRKAGAGITYSPVNPPLPGDTGQYQAIAEAPTGVLSKVAPAGGYAVIKAKFRKPFQAEVTFADPTRYLFNSVPNAPHANNPTNETTERFVCETYRYNAASLITSSKPVVPAGGDIFASAAALAVSGSDLQVVGGALVYPQVNYLGGPYLPQPAPNYSGLPAADGAGHRRWYVRAFNTGMPVRKGKLRIKGIPFTAFRASPYTGNSITDHPGGCFIELFARNPQTNGLIQMDLGRFKGDPDLQPISWYGCLTGMDTFSATDVEYSFELPWDTWATSATSASLFVRVTFINGPGTGLAVTELTYSPLL